ncbi:hypothetical protein [Pontibacillus salipaludis]|uniref:hypothetical protein n=1 Tax=Pontibacillus salipaludis TaxID=1697394 RepID=UPI0031F09CF7
MTYIISGCFEWIGFHLTEKWLNAGHTVIGIDNDWNEQKEWLSLYVGRNSSFHFVDSIDQVKEEAEGEDLILINIEDRLTKREAKIPIKGEWTIKIGDDQPVKGSVIYASEVYGPWMSKLVEPTTEQALYIDDFVKGVHEIIDHNVKKEWIEIKPSSGEQRGHHQDTWYVKESVNVNMGWKEVMDHEEKFSTYYKL